MDKRENEKSTERILKEANLKRTAGRMAVLEVLLEAPRPLSQHEIWERLPSGMNFNSASVYRALEAFLEAGLIHRVETGDRVGRYALCGCEEEGHCHPHFICNSCGIAECLQEVSLPPGYSQRTLQGGYVVEGQEYYLKGLCPRCAAAAAGGSCPESPSSRQEPQE